jgi:hypothetical protein
LKAAWRSKIVSLAGLNSEEKEVVLDEYEDMYLGDEELKEWDEEVMSQYN